MAYVRSGQRRRGSGRMARAHGVSGLGLLGRFVRSPLGAWYKGLGDYYFSSAPGQTSFYDSSTGVTTNLGPGSSALFPSSGLGPGSSALFPSSGLGPGSSGALFPSSGPLTATDAALISQAIGTTGKLVSQDITPIPTLTFNPATGTYTATGAAAVPGTLSSLSLSSTLSSYLPLLLIGGVALVVISMARR